MSAKKYSLKDKHTQGDRVLGAARLVNLLTRFYGANKSIQAIGKWGDTYYHKLNSRKNHDAAPQSIMLAPDFSQLKN